MSGFVHLHLHSEYSLLDGACRIADIPAIAEKFGHSAVALTDHGVMYGAVEFYKACKEHGIKPIIGCEVYVAPGSRFDKQSRLDNYYHMVLLCENEVGYRNLTRLVSAGFTEGFYVRPRVDMELLGKYHEGLIALSGCLSGKIPKLLLRGQYEEAREYARGCSGLFGKDHFYIEIQDHGLEDQKRVLPELVKLAEDCGLPLVATNDCHYLRHEDAEAQAILMCIQTNQTMQSASRPALGTEEFYYKSTEEMQRLFAQYPEALENTVKIAERCRFDFDFSKTFLPTFPCPKGYTAAEYLRHLTEEGYARRKENGELFFEANPESIYRERMEYELGVIEKMGYADYFLIVSDYVGYAKRVGISVGPGRGSGAGSLVAYLLGITDVDSLRFDLLFERFLNPERVSMPDIDIDFCDERRDEVIRYVAEKYGADHVSQIITFGTLAARAVVRDVGRALGMPYAEVDAVAKAIPRDLGMTLDKALKTSEFKKVYEANSAARKLIDTAKVLEGMPRNVSIHAAGIVITENPVVSYVPLSVSNGAVITQYDMDTIAKLGLLKFDFLALRYLTIMDGAEKMVREQEKDFSVSHIPMQDDATFRLISQGDTGGVFQLESAGMRSMLVSMKPTSLEDVQAAIALYRPGPMDSIGKYIEGRRNPSSIVYDIPELEPILKSTCGCVIYQEQVMRIFRELAGYTFGHADIVRRAMSKKKADALEAERVKFLEGTQARGIPRQKAEKLFDDMSSFANYAFNKSHAAAYGIITYRTAYLKAHYPRQFYAALMTASLDNIPKLGEYIVECQKRGIRVLPPSINASEETFHVDGDSIRFGLLALKNLGKQFVEAILAERSDHRYLSFEDFVERMSSASELNKRQIETLIKCGAFDGLGANRNQLLSSYEKLIDFQADKRRSNLSGQLDMFSTAQVQESSGSSVAFQYPNVPELPLRTLLAYEKECAGISFSGHLLDHYSEHLKALKTVPLTELLQAREESDSSVPQAFSDRQAVCVAGIIGTITQKTTKKEEMMAFFTLEDRYVQIECIAFPAKYRAYMALLRVESAVYVEGSLQLRENESPKILVNAIYALADNQHYHGQSVGGNTPKESTPQTSAAAAPAGKSQVPPQEKPAATTVGARPGDAPRASAINIGTASRLYLKVPDMEGMTWRKVENLIEIFDGMLPVVIFNQKEGKYLNCSRGLMRSSVCLEELAALLGKENVVLR